MNKRINGIDWEATELAETLSVHVRIYFATGTDDQGNEFEGMAEVDSTDEITDVTDIEPKK